MLQQVLAIAAAVAHTAHHPHQLNVQAVDAHVDAGALADLHDLLFEVLFRLGNDLLDPSRMDAAVLHQLVQCQARHFAADGVEATENDGAGGVVHHDLHASGFFQSADVPAFTTDDAALQFIVLDVEGAHCVLHGMLRSHALDGLDDDALGVLVGGELGLLHDVLHQGHGPCPGLILQRVHQLLLGLFSVQAADTFQLCHLLLMGLLHFLTAYLQALHTLVNVLLLRIHLLLFDAQFLLLSAKLLLALLVLLQALLNALILFTGITFMFILHLKEFFFGLQDLLLFQGFALGLGLAQDAPAAFLHQVVEHHVHDASACDETDDGPDQCCNDVNVHFPLLFIWFSGPWVLRGAKAGSIR